MFSTCLYSFSLWNGGLQVVWKDLENNTYLDNCQNICVLEELTLSEEVYLIDTARLYLSIIKPAKDKMICFITFRIVKS